MRLAVKKLFADIKSDIAKEGYTVISSEDKIINTKVKINLVCNKGHGCSISYNAFFNKVKKIRCKYCVKEKINRFKFEVLLDVIKNDGYTYLGGRYNDGDSVITVQCKFGHSPVSKKASYILSSTETCGECVKVNKKNTISSKYKERTNNLINHVIGSGYKYVSGEYINSSSLFKIECDKHGVFNKTYYGAFICKEGCPKCSKDKLRKTKQTIIDEMSSLGYTYVKGEYSTVTSKSHITVSCDKHGEFSRPYKSLVALKRGCPGCNVKDKIMEEKTLADLISKKGYTYVKGEYRGYTSKITMMCDKHGEFTKEMGACLSRDRWCAKCGRERIVKSRTACYDAIYSKLKEECGCIMITGERDYRTQRDKVKIKCEKKGHEFQNTPNNIIRAGKCTICSSTTSKQELELLEWVRQYYPSVRKYTFKELEIDNSRREIDIYVPELKLGIEFCGVYWHSEQVWKKENEELVDFKKKHINKFLDTEKKGIHLITIFSDEWSERSFQLKSFLKAKLGVCRRRFYARKCQIKEVDWPIARDFLNKYHIQGKPASSKFSIGLFDGEELLAIMTSAGHHRQGFDSVFVLNRLAYKDDVYIIGGASKLNKALLRYSKDNGYKSLISWSDNRISKGTVYINLGYNKILDVGYDYSYVDGLTRQSKQSNKKKNLLSKDAIGSMDNTERELAITLDLWRIWDCGKRKWEIKI